MNIEDFHINQQVMVQFSSEDWYLDWQHDLGPHKVVGIQSDGLVTIHTPGGTYDFKSSDLEEYEEPNRLESIGICQDCCEAILECDCGRQFCVNCDQNFVNCNC